MRVGVTGAGGYVGRAMVATLAARGHEVHALSRRPLESLPPGVRGVSGDVLAAGTLANFVAPLEAVIHCAAWVHRAAASAVARAECFAVNLGMTKTLIESLERAGGRRGLVFVSTVAVYGERFHAAVETRRWRR